MPHSCLMCCCCSFSVCPLSTKMHLKWCTRATDAPIHHKPQSRMSSPPSQRIVRVVRCCAAPERAATESTPLSRRAAIFGVSLAVAGLSDREASAGPALSVDDVQTRLIKCFEEGQYYVSGKLDRGIFEPDCVFKDPTINVKGTEKYASAVASIFSPETARADLITCDITGPSTIELTWRLEGVISQAGRDFTFKPYTGKTVYTLSKDTGKVMRQDETWDISQLDVFVGLFFPQFGAPAAPPADVLRQRAGRA